MSKEMRDFIDRVKKWKPFLNENNDKWIFDTVVKISDILPVNKDGQSISDALVNVKDGLKSYSDGNVSLMRIGEKYEILDGFHRIAEKILNGEKYVIADVKIDR